MRSSSAASTQRGPARLAHGVTATWWYTASAVLIFELAAVFSAVIVTASAGLSFVALGIVGVGGLVWVGATVALLIDYRHRTDAAPLVLWRRQLLPLVLSVAYGVTAGLTSELWIIGALPILQSLMLLNWQSGVRMRAMTLATAALVCLAIVDTRAEATNVEMASWLPLLTFAILLPAMTVASLWWWDVLLRLDRARASESRLAATQERLRVATDVHDLQGHHLQVIALQLELAERLLEKDADAALEQLRAARASVTDAQQGTRDLALRFRSVPLRDEIANAVDLLQASGTAASADVDDDADRAPASVLGPIIRETTTNVLRHGGGERAHLSLRRQGDSWRYEISNDAAPGAPASADGSGLEGIGRRTADAGGTIDVQRGKSEFVVVVTVPALVEAQR